jgi:hypothetical protein
LDELSVLDMDAFLLLIKYPFVVVGCLI